MHINYNIVYILFCDFGYSNLSILALDPENRPSLHRILRQTDLAPDHEMFQNWVPDLDRQASN